MPSIATFKTQATQDIRRNVANCFVAVEISTDKVAACYTLSAASIPLVDLPAVRIACLGAAILMDAAQRITQGAAAVAFHRHNEFRALVSRPLALFLPIVILQQALYQKRRPKA
jgi:hypothetical protein